MKDSSMIDPLPPIPGRRERCWLKWPDKLAPDERTPIRWSSKSSRGELTVSGLTPRELEAMEAFIRGTSYVRCVEGRLHAYDAHEPLPTPEEDPLMGPHWSASGEPKQWGGITSGEGWHSPGLIITALGAGIDRNAPFGKDQAARNQALVESFGFVCLRSRRGDDGGYWEQWVLHFLEAARGDLEQHLKTLPPGTGWHERAEAAAGFIAKHIRFGSLDITIQRWALAFD